MKVGELYFYRAVYLTYDYVFKITPRYTHYVQFVFYDDNPKHPVRVAKYIDNYFEASIASGLRKLSKKRSLIKTVFKRVH